MKSDAHKAKKLGRSDMNTTALFIGSQHEVSLHVPGDFLLDDAQVASGTSYGILLRLARKGRVR